VYATFETSTVAIADKYGQEYTDALKLLDFLAYMHRNSVPEGVLVESWKTSQKILNEVGEPKHNVQVPSE
jgi:hypothetical protein